MFTAPEGSNFLCWQCGETQYHENDSFTVTEDVTFTASVEEPPVVFGDDVTGWYANMPVTGTYDEGDEFVVTGDVTFTAVTRLMPTATFDGSGATVIWRDPNAWDILGETLNAAPNTDLGTITLTEDIAADIGSLPLTVPAGVTVTINLNGHTLDGTNAAVMGNGSIIFVYGDLTLTNSGENAAVTGGGVQVYSNAAFDPAAVEANFGAKLLMTYDYDNDDTNQEFENQLYAAVWYPTLYDAFTAAATIPKDFKDDLDLPANNIFSPSESSSPSPVKSRLVPRLM